MDDAELGPVLVMASSMRCSLVASSEVSQDFFDGLDLHSERALFVPFKLNRLIQQYQRDGAPILAAGVMVWLHSARAILQPELRLTGREMWRELVRGWPHIEDAAALLLDSGVTEKALAIILDESRFIPTPLLPRQ